MTTLAVLGFILGAIGFALSMVGIGYGLHRVIGLLEEIVDGVRQLRTDVDELLDERPGDTRLRKVQP